MSYIPVLIERRDPVTEEWTENLKLHALKANRAGGSETYAAGQEQYHARITFEFRWCQALELLRWAPQEYRITYRGQTLNILDYDDYMEQHLMVKLTGEAYG